LELLEGVARGVQGGDDPRTQNPRRDDSVWEDFPLRMRARQSNINRRNNAEESCTLSRSERAVSEGACLVGQKRLATGDVSSPSQPFWYMAHTTWLQIKSSVNRFIHPCRLVQDQRILHRLCPTPHSPASLPSPQPHPLALAIALLPRAIADRCARPATCPKRRV